MDFTATIIFVIASFVLGAVVFAKRESIAPQFRRSLALISIAFIAFSFFLVVYSLFTMGQE
ncbi:hypothetical protein [Paenibacillus radicis (ex Gao et al. 2016)]|uniref:Signal transduction histidine kinase n=1 Tax=Paenibacillus radicis (ex Gao et al. 2016) TaxID=1737354 RepID=A0A917GS55_9BACL|nr:hypothetical protein [Paenibacillus radicis (ex Gao et al. 2016)]GGG55625.1 hypothetical protein GCM10010918_05660 [Paenibacillus radicis (ex Gao et al. 2016)]